MWFYFRFISYLLWLRRYQLRISQIFDKVYDRLLGHSSIINHKIRETRCVMLNCGFHGARFVRKIGRSRHVRLINMFIRKIVKISAKNTVGMSLVSHPSWKTHNKTDISHVKYSSWKTRETFSVQVGKQAGASEFCSFFKRLMLQHSCVVCDPWRVLFRFELIYLAPCREICA